MATGALSIGIDLGGTKIAIGLVDAHGRILNREERQSVLPPGTAKLTPARHIHYVVTSIVDAIEDLLLGVPTTSRRKRLEPIRGVGLASAGPMNIERGELIFPANFKGWKVVPLVSLLSRELTRRKLGRPVYFQNDAMAASLGEGWCGAAKGCKTYVTVTLGTGIGSGVIMNGRPAQSAGMGSEWGHILVDLALSGHTAKNFPYHSSVEGLASGTGMLRRAREQGSKHTSMIELANAAKNHNRLALEIFENAAKALAMLFFNLSMGFHVERILLMGGLMNVQELFLPQAKALYQELIHANNKAFLAKIVPAKLGNDAGIIGAACLTWL